MDDLKLKIEIRFTWWGRLGLHFAGLLASIGVEIDVDKVADHLVRHSTIRITSA